MKNAFLSVGFLAIALPLLFRLYDYNRYIQIPYWLTFSYCYIFSESERCETTKIRELENWTKAQWNWDLEDLPPGDYPVPEIAAEDYSLEKFREVSKNFMMPVIVRGLFNGTKASRTWSPEFFSDGRYGEDYYITMIEGGIEQQYAATKRMTGRAGTSLQGNGYTDLMSPVKMKLKNAIKHMQQGERVYVTNIDTIFRKNNELIDDLELHRMPSWVYHPYRPYMAQIFLGYGSANPNQTTGTLVHCDSLTNLFFGIHGEKDWAFVAPRYSMFLQPSLGLFTPAASALKKPEEAGVPVFRTTVRPGDMLFNPPWWWHEVKNHEGWVAAAATRDSFASWIAKNNFLFTFLLEFRLNRRIAEQVIPKERKLARAVVAVPLLSFVFGLLKESITGPTAHPLFTAAFNPCDSHDPTGCVSSFADKSLYSDEGDTIPYRD